MFTGRMPQILLFRVRLNTYLLLRMFAVTPVVGNWWPIERYTIEKLEFLPLMVFVTGPGTGKIPYWYRQEIACQWSGKRYYL